MKVKKLLAIALSLCMPSYVLEVLLLLLQVQQKIAIMIECG